MDASLTAFVHSAKMRHGNAAELAVPHGLARLINNFHEYMTLGDVVIPCARRTRYREQSKL
jgi:hypothetical protein